MPSVVEESKGRAKLFDTLDRTGTHFIAVGSESGSSPPSSSSCGSSGYQEDQEEGDEEKAGLAFATAGGRARTKGGDIYNIWHVWRFCIKYDTKIYCPISKLLRPILIPVLSSG